MNTLKMDLINYCMCHNNDKFIEIFESNNLDPSMKNNIFSKKAIIFSNISILSYLLKKGANISNKNMYKSTFSRKIKIDMIKFLFDYGIDFISDDKFILYCIDISHCVDNVNIVEFLLKQGIDPNRLSNITEEHLIDSAIRNRNLKLVEILISYGADPSLSTSKCLSLAIQTGEEELIRLLLNKGALQSSVTPEDLSIILKTQPRPSLSLINFLANQNFDFTAINSIKFNKPHTGEIYPALIELGIEPIQLIRMYASDYGSE